MKNLLCLSMMILGGISSSFAQDHKTVTEYYGTKASTNANNPCKGATVRICGRITSELMQVEKTEDITTYDRTKWVEISGDPAKQYRDVLYVPNDTELLTFLQNEAGDNANVIIIK